ncbi:hypothetical protein GCM10020000_01820 [Streptomyces olivoverticillatus]
MAAGPREVKWRVSTPQGTTEQRSGAMPMRASSRTSSEQVARTRAQEEPILRSVSSRSGGLVSVSFWCRRLTVPRAWKVWTTGTARPRVPSRAAMPDIQKWA